MDTVSTFTKISILKRHISIEKISNLRRENLKIQDFGTQVDPFGLKSAEFHEVREGDVFDLGGLTLEVQDIYRSV